MIHRALLIALLFCTSACFAQLKKGDVAPNFTLKTLDGHTVTLADYKGKVILVNFWATWCTPCQTEIPRFMAFQREFTDNKFQVIGISMDDSEEPVRAFTAKLKVNYPVGMGNTKLAESYGGVLGLPITFLIDRDGQLFKRYEGVIDLDSMQKDIQTLLP